MISPSGSAAFVILAAMGLPITFGESDRPGFNYHAESTEMAPCGIGTPLRGHAVREVRPGPNGITLTVRQDAHRLCYVSDGIAEAPVIRVRQGDPLAITLRNEITDPAALEQVVAAERLAHPNEPVPATAGFVPVRPGMHHAITGATNLHVHGFSVPPLAPQDEVMKICVDPASGKAVCGRREFTYRYQVPASMPAGLYWYHPHVHGAVQAQMLMGLSGAIVVEGPEDDARRAAGISDRVLIVRQAQDIDSEAAPAPSVPGKPAHAASQEPPSRVAAAKIDTAHEVPCSPKTGGNLLTLNGSAVREGRARDFDLANLRLAAGHQELWRVLNAASDAYLNLKLVDEKGRAQPVEIVARDGAPITADDGTRLRTVTSEPQLVPPAGRLEFLVTPPPAGSQLYLVSEAVDTGCAGDSVPRRVLARVTMNDAEASAKSGESPAPPLTEPPAPDVFSGLLARKADQERVIVLAEYPRPGSEDQTDFYIAEKKPGMVLRPFEMGGPPTLVTEAGSVEEWAVENWTREVHAFHVHQVHFRVLAVNGAAERDPPLLDVVNVPAAVPADPHRPGGPLVPGRVRIKLAFPAELAGDIPFHCHLVDHEDNGMMAVLRVLAPGASAAERKAELSPAFLLSHPPICRAAPSAKPSRTAAPG